MNCTDIQTNIDDYLEQGLTSFESKAFDEHVSNCPTCQCVLDDAQKIQHALQNLPLEEADSGFEERVLSNVHNRYKQQQSKNHFVSGFATAMAASLAIWFAVSLFQPEMSEQNISVVNLSVDAPRTVKLKFDAPTRLDQVTMSIELPDHVELSNYPGQKTLSWKTSLKKGSNVLSLPVIAIGNGKGKLIAHIKYGNNKMKNISIILNSNTNGAWLYKSVQIPAA